MTSKLCVIVSFLIAVTGCQTRSSEVERVREQAKEVAKAAQQEADIARASIAKRLDQLDQEIDQLDKRVVKASGKAKAKLQEQSQELRADARKLRDRMSTWDDKVESAWRTSKREIEQGLEKAEDSVKKLLEDKS